MVAKCAACAEVFVFAPGDLAPAPALTLALPTPKGITLLRGASHAIGESDPYRGDNAPDDSLVVIRKWYSPQAIALLFFALFWDSFLVVWYFGATAGSAPWIFFVFPLLHVSAGFWITYTAVAGLLNQTHFSVAQGTLTVREGPIPTGRNRLIAVSEIVTLYTKEEPRDRGARSYSLRALLGGGETVALGSKFDASEQALFIEQAFEEHLRLAAHRVPGEFRG